MKLVRYNPFNQLRTFSNPFNNLFDDSFFFPTEKNELKQFAPAVDIINEDDSIIINVELAGVKKDDLSIDIKDNILTIKGEKKYEKEVKEDNFYRKERSSGSFQRSFSLSDDVMTDNVDAQFTDGVLKIKLLKDEKKEEVKKITIN